jgi:hypothetical protein
MGEQATMKVAARFAAASALAVVVVLGLVYAASLLDWLERPTGAELVKPPVHRSTFDVSIAECDALISEHEQKIAQMIEAGRQCSTDSQCQVASFGCLFGCRTAVNRSAVLGIEAALTEYEAAHRACGGCVYSCTPLPEGQAVCEDNLCAYRVGDPRPWWMPPDKPTSEGSDD